MFFAPSQIQVRIIENQGEAELARSRKAAEQTIVTAQADNQKRILQADADLARARRQAEQTVLTAEAESKQKVLAGRGEGAQRLQNLTWDEARRGRAIVGTAEMVADNLESLREQLGLAGILAELNTGGLIPHERVMRSMQLLCDKVQPQLH